MAFQRDGSNNVIAFAEAEDLRNVDQRFFEKNEITFADSGTAAVTLNDYLDILCQRATDRITTKMQASPEWNTYTSSMNLTSATSILPPVNKNLILGNLQDWTDLCVSYVFKEYLYPRLADFGNPESSEVQKINFYDTKFNNLFSEKMAVIIWYDADNDATLESDDQKVNYRKNRRTRGKRFITRVR
jgi:hypothetical protein